MKKIIKNRGFTRTLTLKNKRKLVCGFMVVEILVAVSIITISILAAMTVAQKSVYVSRQAFHSTQAGFLLEEGAEAVRILRDNAWTNISELNVNTNYYLKFSGGTWITSTTDSDGTVGIFTRKITFANVNRDANYNIVTSGGTLESSIFSKLVTVTVSWLEGGTTVTKTLQFYLMDIFS